MPAQAAALRKLLSHYAARSNNTAIWRPARPVYVWMPSLWCVTHRGSVHRGGVNATVGISIDGRASEQAKSGLAGSLWKTVNLCCRSHRAWDL